LRENQDAEHCTGPGQYKGMKLKQIAKLAFVESELPSRRAYLW